MVEASAVLVQAINGLSQAMLFILIASGLSIIFGLMDVLNFAHGAFYMLGAYVGFVVFGLTGQFFFAVVGAFIVVGLLGAALEYLTLRPLYDRSPEYHLLVTFGFLLIFEQTALAIWGSDVRSLPPPDILTGSVQLIGLSYPVYRLFLLGFGALFAVALYLVIYYTNFGLIVRAGTYNKEIVRAFGINLPRIFTLTFAAGVAIAGISGVFAGPIFGLTPVMGSSVVIDAFIIVIIGGLGSFRGTIIAAILISEIRALGQLVLPRFTVLLVLAALIIVLTVKPEGLFGTTAAGGD